ncbi:hypothetical protein ACFLSJ_06245 [Verrucomicrobiota bacterium]
MRHAALTTVFAVFALQAFSATILDQQHAVEQANRPEFSLGHEEDGVFLGEKKQFTEEDVKWMNMAMRPGWFYTRNATTTIAAPATHSRFWDTDFYIHWLSEVGWTSQILYNDGETIVELRYYSPENRLSLLECRVRIEFTPVLALGRTLDRYAQRLMENRNSEEAMDRVKTVCGEFLEVAAKALDKAQFDFKQESSRKAVTSAAGEYRGLLEDSTFQNVWYLIVYRLTTAKPDVLMRLELDGEDFRPWEALNRQDKEEEELRRQVIIRSAYLMDAQVLPPSRKLDKVNEPWTVPASAFGQVVGNDLASDLDQISGAITLRRVDDLKVDDRKCVYIKKVGSSSDNRITFLYRPQTLDSSTVVNRDLVIDPEDIVIFFDQEQDHQIYRAELAGKIDFEEVEHVKLWPDAKLTAQPYVQALYKSEVIAKDTGGSSFDRNAMTQLAPLIKEKTGVSILAEPPAESVPSE